MRQLDAERVKEQADIVRVVGEYVELKRGGNADERVGLCPFHDERTPSFTVTVSKQVFYCFGCQAGGDVFDFVSRIEGAASFNQAVRKVAEIAGIPEVPEAPRNGTAATGTRKSATPVTTPKVTASYPYTDEYGELLYEVQRVEPGRNGKAKEFRQRRPHPVDGEWVWGISAGRYRKGSGGWFPVKGEAFDGDDELPEVRRVLYRLPEVLKADTVYLVEGEKDVHTLEAAGLVATTNSGGAAQKWLPEWTAALAARRVIVLPDNDEPGRKRAGLIVKELRGKAAEVLAVEVPCGKDVTDYFSTGKSVTDLQALVEEERRKQRSEEIEQRGLLSPREIVEYFDGGISAFLDPSKRGKGLETGFHRLDEMTLGLQRGELVILAARPAMGKTSLALNIATHVAAAKKAVAIFSLEMSRESLLTRMICALARVDQMKFRSGYLNADERRRLMGALADVCEMPVFIDDHAATDLKSIQKKLARVRQEHGLDLVVIDYLQLMNVSKRENRTQEVGALSRGLKLMAREYHVPFLVLSQLSRAPEARPGNHRPQLSDLRESGGIEQDADIVMFIYREEVYKPEKTELRGLAELRVAKQRNGPTGTVKLTYLHAFTKFENWTGGQGGQGGEMGE